jgi:hypothetical protein
MSDVIEPSLDTLKKGIKIGLFLTSGAEINGTLHAVTRRFVQVTDEFGTRPVRMYTIRRTQIVAYCVMVKP